MTVRYLRHVRLPPSGVPRTHTVRKVITVRVPGPVEREDRASCVVPARAEAQMRSGVGVAHYGCGMAKAARVLAALKRDGWVEVRRRGSHRVLVKGDQQVVFAFHDSADLGGPMMARVARQFGYTVDELRRL